MKKTVATLSIAAAALAIVSCTDSHPKAPVFKTDRYGVVEKIDTQQKFVYLVFTAHYSEADSGRFENFDGVVPVLNTLKEKGVKGSFFPTGVCFTVDRYREPLHRIIDEGHYLSAHSYGHLLLCDYDDPEKSLVTADSLRADFAKMEFQLMRLGLKKEQFRWIIPPYEHYNQFTADAMRALGYSIVNPTRGLLTGMDWTSPGSSNYVSTDEIIDNLWEYERKNTLNGVVLLIHAMNYPDRTDDDRPYNRLGEIIDTLRSRGYGFRTMTDVIEAENAANAANAENVEPSAGAAEDAAKKVKTLDAVKAVDAADVVQTKDAANVLNADAAASPDSATR